MAQKHRFKKEREFKQRLEETEQNEESDIRSFTFHHHDLEKHEREERKVRRNDRRDDREDRRGGRKEKSGRFDRGNRKFNKTGNNFTKKRRFDDDED